MNAYSLIKSLYIPQLLIIAGNARNVGKTTLAIQLISRFAANYKIVAFKVSSIKPNDAKWHGHHKEPIPDTYIINVEDASNCVKDTAQMRAAGAMQAFYIRTREAYIHTALQDLMHRIPPDCLLICESRSLGELVKPGLLVVLHKLGGAPGIKDTAYLEAMADVVIQVPENGHYPAVTSEMFTVEKGIWVYKPKV